MTRLSDERIAYVSGLCALADEAIERGDWAHRTAFAALVKAWPLLVAELRPSSPLHVGGGLE